MSVSLSVFVSVKSHLISGASVHSKNTAMYSAGNEGQKFCGVFSETVPLQRSSAPSHDGHTAGQPFFLHRTRMHIFHTQVLKFDSSQCDAPYPIA